MFQNLATYVKISVVKPKIIYAISQEPPNLLDSGDAPDLPARPKTIKTPPPTSPSPSAAEIDEQARMLKQYEDKQAALQAQREAEERRRFELEQQQQQEFDQRQREQAEAQRIAQEQLAQQQAMYNNQAARQQSELEQELLNLRGHFQRDQIFLEQYDRVNTYTSNSSCNSHVISGLKLWRQNWPESMPTLTPKWQPKMN